MEVSENSEVSGNLEIGEAETVNQAGKFSEQGADGEFADHTVTAVTNQESNQDPDPGSDQISISEDEESSKVSDE